MLKGNIRATPSFAQLKSTLRNDFSLVRPAIYIAGNKINNLIVKLIDTQITSTWYNKPKITKKIVSASKRVDYIVTVEGDNFFFVTVGASPHIIEAVRAPELAFPIEYTPMTKLGTLQSVTGGKNWGGAWFYGDFVNHPGFKPRNLDEKILRKLGDEIYNILYSEIARVI